MTTPPQRYERSSAEMARPKGCGNKIRYPKRKQALSALNRLRAADPGDPDVDILTAYRCRYGCRGFHIGHDQRLR